MFSYYVKGKSKLDSELSPMISKYIENYGLYPTKISVSPAKMKELDNVFPSIHDSYFEFEGIRVSIDENQVDDYKLT